MGIEQTTQVFESSSPINDGDVGLSNDLKQALNQKERNQTANPVFHLFKLKNPL
jgi:hypothetical protein